HPPRGWRRLLPVSLQTPPVPIDDYVAVILAQRYLDGK
ncbi:MAG TPA: pre-16S rRNA-processing nuclease YqgF, partial [Limnochordia bacterium]|nr:pre-16S rRNA-processing nuclease YqgF [Limnochordia bacterium]